MEGKHFFYDAQNPSVWSTDGMQPDAHYSNAIDIATIKVRVTVSTVNSCLQGLINWP